MTHKSYSNEKKASENGLGAEHNERLEFLGDAVLSASLSARLMREFPLENEGALSKRRASLVNEERLASLSTRLGLHERLKLGKGEMKTGGASKPRLLACGLEALIGGIFLDAGAQGYEAADRVIGALFAGEIEGLREAAVDYERDYKTRLQEWIHGQKGATPTYQLLEEFGPAHNRSFRVAVMVGDSELAQGEGKSKKAAEQEAAKAALSNAQQLEPQAGLKREQNG
jgi:ribonuclease-3